MYVHRSRIGLFRIAKNEEDGRWVAWFEDEPLGSYEQPWGALDDLVGGHTFSLSNGVDTSTLDLPAELGEWHAM